MTELDEVPAATFVERMAPLFEGAPGFLWRLAAARPFGSRKALLARAREIAHELPEPLQVELIDAHPRLGAARETVSALSFREQGYDRDAPRPQPDAVAMELERLNRAYEERFGFRYCVFVAGRPRSALLADMAASLEAPRAAELDRAIDAVVDIAADRWRAVRG